ncbi:glycosyltransferase [bacterium]|nr:glycosyltransferase [bacterium]
MPRINFSGYTPQRGVFINMPILNEAEVITTVLENMRTMLDGLEYTICIVDDGSDDGTIEQIEKFQLNYGHVHLVKRRKQKRGCQRGGALKLALDWGIKNTDYDVFIEMDGDMSHRPEEFETGIMLLKIYDVAIASKYLTGSKSEKRGFFRTWVSRVYNFFVRLLIWIPVIDFSNGYRFYNRRAAEILSSYKVKYTSPLYLIEALSIWYNNGLSIGEFPSIYIGRPHGYSKVILSDFCVAPLAVVDIAYRYRIKRSKK